MTEMNHNPLGAAVGTGGTAPRNGFDEGEHGAGIGLSGGADAPNAHNSLSGGAGGASSHPIADKFMGQSTGDQPYRPADETIGHGATAAGAAGAGYGFSGATGGSKLDNALDNYTEGSGGAAAAGLGAGALAGAGAGAGASGRDATTGAYAGVGGGDALTGQANTRSTGEGVGFGGENISGGGSATAAGAAGASAGAAAAGASSGATGTTDLSKGHYGTVDNDPSRGQPVADPAEIDSGGRHGLVFDEKTGTYEHRHVLDEGAKNH